MNNDNSSEKRKNTEKFNTLMLDHATGDDRNLAEHGKDRKYHYSIGDGFRLLIAIRKNKLIYYQNNEIPFNIKAPGEEYNSTRENINHIFIADPYHIDNFSNAFSDDIKTITGKHTVDEHNIDQSTKNNCWSDMPTTLILPLLAGIHWYCIRIQIDYTNLSVSILWDDPFGQISFPQSMMQQILLALLENIQCLIQTQNGNLEFQLVENDEMKHIKQMDQQGFLKNEYDCGAIIFTNISDYTNIQISNVEFANSTPQQSCYTISHSEDIQHEIQMQDIRAKDIIICREVSGFEVSEIHFKKLASIQKIQSDSRSRKLQTISKTNNNLIASKFQNLNDVELEICFDYIQAQRIYKQLDLDDSYSNFELEEATRFLTLRRSAINDIDGSENVEDKLLVSEQPIQQPFSWQVYQHYHGILKHVEAMTEKEFNNIIEKLSKEIKKMFNDKEFDFKQFENQTRETLTHILFEHVTKKLAFRILGIPEKRARAEFLNRQNASNEYSDEDNDESLEENLIKYYSYTDEDYFYRKLQEIAILEGDISFESICLATDKMSFSDENDLLWSLYLKDQLADLSQIIFYTGKKNITYQALENSEWDNIRSWRQLLSKNKNLSKTLKENGLLADFIKIKSIEDNIVKRTIKNTSQHIKDLNFKKTGTYIKILEAVKSEQDRLQWNASFNHQNNSLEIQKLNSLIKKHGLETGLNLLRGTNLGSLRSQLHEQLTSLINHMRLRLYIAELKRRIDDEINDEFKLKQRINDRLWEEYREELERIDEDPRNAEYDYGIVRPDTPPIYERPENFYDRDEFEDLNFLPNLLNLCGGNTGLSWLINQIVEYEVDLPTNILEKMDYATSEIDEDIAKFILYSMCLYRDYEVYDIGKKGFILTTFLTTLEELKQSFSRKETIIRDIKQEFAKIKYLINMGKFKQLQEDFDRAYQQKNLIEMQKLWSVFTKFQELLIATSEQINSINIKKKGSGYDFTSKFKEKITDYNKLLKIAYESYAERAEGYYRRIYPSHNTRYLTYSSKNPDKTYKNAILDIQPLLTELETVGRKIKAVLVKQNEKDTTNIVVPMLCFVVSTKPHIKGGTHKRIFVPIALNLSKYKNALLAKDAMDGVFTKNDDTYFYQAIERDHYLGSTVVFGADKSDKYKKEIQHIDSNLKPQSFYHSERVYFEILRDKANIKEIINLLQQELVRQLGIEQLEKGAYKIYSVAELLYSTNSICDKCTISIIALQNSYQDGFLKNLIEELNNPEDTDKHFKVRGFDPQKAEQNPTKFNLFTIVSADKAYTEQAADMATDPNNNKQQKANRHHNPKAKLFFPNDAIDIHTKVNDISPRSTFFEFIKSSVNSTEPVLQDSKTNFVFFGKTFMSKTKSSFFTQAKDQTKKMEKVQIINNETNKIMEEQKTKQEKILKK